MKKFLLAPSILSANFAKLGEDIKKVILAGCDMIHYDVMDNHYVSNLTMGPMILKSLKKYGINVPIDVHIMAKPVDNLIKQFIEIGVDYISFHPETSKNIYNTIQIIKKNGCKVGIAINPYTSLNCLNYIINEIDMILIMSVNPGLEGQKFIPFILNKLYDVNKLIKKNDHDILLEVDGGIKINNICKIAKTGVDIFVFGTEIFKKNNYNKTIYKMKKELRKIIF
ncbi:ribulose-phosphate 3-epimerase [Candidatus Purcelliella pentastirinorum]|uniref:Ribulose-phosphate 3-epimerase n=1 Tax=Candidatus Purcelliella pentastirinorum TaxID=472834 RepID=A0AAX3N7X2_9ENTR|nr:ribulose-phosphate 3-epimerase [Candidatus Purcelliella pentastirinorum]WDI78721.1 ribulose-phosphate 3-epimerase [Candidatus Purcelliella pentastirinorum]WDR80668.1 ribulose-phosphate 3-epimerase [Candidatus Purcelliella pentastirinorum]